MGLRIQHGASGGDEVRGDLYAIPALVLFSRIVISLVRMHIAGFMQRVFAKGGGSKRWAEAYVLTATSSATFFPL